MPASTTTPPSASRRTPSSSRSSSSHRHHHHHNNFPPRAYTDLSTADINLLAPLFGPLPPRTLSIHATHTATRRQSISVLPSHLQAKVPFLSPFCSAHKHLNPLPITSILNFVQHEVLPGSLNDWKDAVDAETCWLDLPTIWLLQEMNAIWWTAEKFEAVFNRPPKTATTRWVYQDNKCAACKLIAVASNVPGMIALSGCLVARLDPGVWRKSKRVRWCEEWLKGSVEWSFQADGVVKAMWECGVRLRRAMREVTGDEMTWGEGKGKSKAKEGREYVDEFVEQAKKPLRPGRDAGQEDHVAWVLEKDDGMVENKMNPFEARKRASKKDMSLPAATLPYSRPGANIPPPRPAARPQPLKTNVDKDGSPLPKRHISSIGFFGRAQNLHMEATPADSPQHALRISSPVLQSPPASSDSTTGLFPTPPSPTPGSRNTAHLSAYPSPLHLRKRAASSVYSRATDDPSSPIWRKGPHQHDNPFSPSFEFEDIEEEEDDDVLVDGGGANGWETGSDWNAAARRKRGTRGDDGNGVNWWETIRAESNEWRESEFIDSYLDREVFHVDEDERVGGKGKGVDGRNFI